MTIITLATELQPYIATLESGEPLNIPQVAEVASLLGGSEEAIYNMKQYMVSDANMVAYLVMLAVRKLDGGYTHE